MTPPTLTTTCCGAPTLVTSVVDLLSLLLNGSLILCASHVINLGRITSFRQMCRLERNANKCTIDPALLSSTPFSLTVRLDPPANIFPTTLAPRPPDVEFHTRPPFGNFVPRQPSRGTVQQQRDSISSTSSGGRAGRSSGRGGSGRGPNAFASSSGRSSTDVTKPKKKSIPVEMIPVRRLYCLMGQGGDAADWTSDTKDVTNLIRYFHTQRGRFGDGGNPDKTLLNDAAAHLSSLGPPKHGGPKTPDSITARWNPTKKPIPVPLGGPTPMSLALTSLRRARMPGMFSSKLATRTSSLLPTRQGQEAHYQSDSSLATT
ncbi:hypothetical protein B0H13DRAFT_1924843 [Mycena leptocephala]|nr:hypothetical protein B0H13DRAFT_1924843 [Mycena leptocephala]